MPHPLLDRSRLTLYPLGSRHNKVKIEQDAVWPDDSPKALGADVLDAVAATAHRMRQARSAGRPVVLAFGAHTIKNGLGPVLIWLMREGWVQHLATNGAGIIHDWELAFFGETSEDVRANVAEGRFGLWQETGHHLNLALLAGACDGLGYGESVGRLIAVERHDLPSVEDLQDELGRGAVDPAADLARAAAAADLLGAMRRHGLGSGTVSVPHPFKQYSVQAAAFTAGVPFTGHPMFGHDIIYTHPLCHGAAIGRAAERDFLAFAHQISRIDGGVYLSVGSAVMSPMVFEKSMSMGQNLALAEGRAIRDHTIVVVDLAESAWDWAGGEPPEDRPEYYLRYCKTFSRMGGVMRYVTADNRDFLLALCRALRSQEEGT